MGKGEYSKMKKKKRNVRMRRRVAQSRFSILLISCVVIALTVILSFASVSLIKKYERQKEQIAELEKQLEAEDMRAEEIDELEEYVGTDKYIEDVARETGLVYPDEILIKPE